MPAQTAAVSGHEDERHESGIGAMSRVSHTDLQSETQSRGFREEIPGTERENERDRVRAEAIETRARG